MMRLGRIRLMVAVFCVASAAPALGRDVYMAPDGKDTNEGTVEKPFLSITRAQMAVGPGETVYMRGGKYNVTADQIVNPRAGVAVHVFEIAKSGREGAMITYQNYKDEVPVFDFSSVKPNARVYAFYVSANWVHFQGFEVTGIQVTQTGHTQSECFENHGSNNVYDRLKMHDGMAIGYYALEGSNNLVINCDAWNNYDTVSENGRGGNTDGFGCHVKAGGTGNVFRYCRAWYNSDDGYDCINCMESVLFDHCWAMYNGKSEKGPTPGDGNGFKAGGYGKPPTRSPMPVPRNRVEFCLAVGNKSSGFYANHHTGGADWINNTAYGNANNFNMLECLLTNVDIPGPNAFMRNNLGYKAKNELASLDFLKSDLVGNYFKVVEGKPVFMVVGDGDFVSLDEKQLVGPRKADGSLPEVTFMRLKGGSKLIDAGAEVKDKEGKVRFESKGAGPDMGCFEVGGEYGAGAEKQP